MKANRPCPKCNGGVEEGFILDVRHLDQAASVWVEGAPERGFLSSVTTSHKRRYPVSSFRCLSCGYLEFFAGSPAAPEAVTCLECGVLLPDGATKCMACGWSYEAG